MIIGFNPASIRYSRKASKTSLLSEGSEMTPGSRSAMPGDPEGVP
jgi:hypothetical protein